MLLHQSDRVMSAQLKRKALRTAEEGEDEDGESGRGVDKKLKSLNSSDVGSSSSGSSSSTGGNVITTAEMMHMMAAASKEGEAIFSSLLGPTPSDSVSSSSQSTSTPSDKDDPPGGGGGVAGAGGTGVRSRVTDAHLDVAQIFKKKKADSKKLYAQALANEYNPLDFMDWTARSL